MKKIFYDNWIAKIILFTCNTITLGPFVLTKKKNLATKHNQSRMYTFPSMDRNGCLFRHSYMDFDADIRFKLMVDADCWSFLLYMVCLRILDKTCCI